MLSWIVTALLLVGAAAPAAASGSTVADDLRYLREEEKLARDVYRTLGERYPMRIFDHISSAEQVHMDRVKALLDARGLDDPVAGDSVGRFTSSELAALYEKLVEQGQASDVAALTVGATVEDLDLRDIEEMAKRAQDADVLAAYDDLMRGSRNHMRAYVRQLRARGADYEAQYLNAEQLASILGSEHERGGAGLAACRGGAKGCRGGAGTGCSGGRGRGAGAARNGGHGHHGHGHGRADARGCGGCGGGRGV
jgi:hypothetical protein